MTTRRRARPPEAFPKRAQSDPRERRSILLELWHPRGRRAFGASAAVPSPTDFPMSYHRRSFPLHPLRVLPSGGVPPRITASFAPTPRPRRLPTRPARRRTDALPPRTRPDDNGLSWPSCAAATSPGPLSAFAEQSRKPLKSAHSGGDRPERRDQRRALVSCERRHDPVLIEPWPRYPDDSWRRAAGAVTLTARFVARDGVGLSGAANGIRPASMALYGLDHKQLTSAMPCEELRHLSGVFGLSLRVQRERDSASTRVAVAYSHRAARPRQATRRPRPYDPSDPADPADPAAHWRPRPSLSRIDPIGAERSLSRDGRRRARFRR